VADLRAAVAELFRSYSQAAHHDFKEELLVLDVDLSPRPSSAKAEGSERGYMGGCRSKTGRKLVRMRAAGSQETVWETVVSGGPLKVYPSCKKRSKEPKACWDWMEREKRCSSRGSGQRRWYRSRMR
jgi:hypothetical protein